MDREMREKVEQEYERWSSAVPKASFEMIWLLLVPGVDVYCDENASGSKEPFVISYVDFDIPNKSWNQYKVKAWHLDGDDNCIQPVEVDFTIDPFHGEKPIQELEETACLARSSVSIFPRVLIGTWTGTQLAPSQEMHVLRW
jgi:hypothetical protein